jgi:hypothetical protein
VKPDRLVLIALQSVAVRCRGIVVNITVTKTTTAQDVLQACSYEMEKMSRHMNPDANVLIEPLSNSGVERRLRRYELVCDVMNSWEDDSQYKLMVSPGSPETDKELDLGNVPRTPSAPDGFSIALYHSQRPGKWTKCYIVLYQSGQMLASKKPDPGRSDKHVVTLCHLSDYDIYSPTEAHMRKVLKPPKKYCYAVKSQQRSALFVNNSNYVHFFCTDDREAAQRFHSLVHGWRSWYLVNRKLNLRSAAERRPQKYNEDSGYKSAPIDFESTPPASPKHYPIPPLPVVPAAYLKENKSAFAANGLLGDRYDKRKAQAINNGSEQKIAQEADPFTDGPSLLNSRTAPSATPAYPTTSRPRTSSGSDGPATTMPNINRAKDQSFSVHSPQQQAQRPVYPTSPPTRRPSTSSRPPSIAPSRAPSIRERPQQQQQPLVDLTPTFVEPPQWSREGRGRGVRVTDGKPLVDLATNPVLPPSSTAARLLKESPPQNLIRRAEAGSSSSSNGASNTKPATLMQQYELREQQKRRRGATVTNGSGSGIGLGSSGLVSRSRSVRSTAGGATAMSRGAMTAAEADLQSRGRVMGVGELDRGRVRERRRSVDNRER